MEQNNNRQKPDIDITQIPTFNTAQSSSFISPIFTKIPNQLVSWLMKDLSFESVQKVLSQPTFQKKIKGMRNNTLSKEQFVVVLSEEFHNNLSFRTFLGTIWKEQRKENLKLLDMMSFDEFTRNYAELLKKYGKEPLYWYCAYSENPRLQKIAFNIAQECAANEEKAASEHRLKHELDAALSVKKGLEIQLQTEREFTKKLKEEILSLKSEIKSWEKELEKEKQSGKKHLGEISELEAKINSLSSADQTIHALEKTNRSLEHDLIVARKAVDEMGKKSKSASDEKEHFLAMKNEMEKTILALYAIFKHWDTLTAQSAIVAKKESRQAGKVFLIIGEENKLPIEYYNLISSVGAVLHYHAEFKHDLELEKKLSGTNMIFLFLPDWKELNKHEDLVGYLRKNKLPFLILPRLSPQVFFCFIQNFT